MPTPRRSPLSVTVDPKAQVHAKEYVDALTESLLIQAKVLAARQGMDLVQPAHIDLAYEVLAKAELGRKGWREYLGIIGGACLGVAAPGFLAEITKPNHADINVVLLTIYAVLGLVGLALVTFVSFGARR